MSCFLKYLAIYDRPHEALHLLVSSVRARVANTSPASRRKSKKEGIPSFSEALLIAFE